MKEQTRRTVVVLGGYGKAGAAVANQLHELAPDIHIDVAGRRIEEAEQTARHVDNDGSGRVTAAPVDIASASELDDLLAGASLCMAALPGSAVTGGLVEAVIRNRVHYLDLTPSSHLDPVLDQRVSDVEQAGVAIMRQAGLLPGSAAAVGRYAASLIAEPVVSVQVDTFLHDPDIPDVGKIHPKVVQERLGHSSISITLDRYSHVVEGMDREAAEIVAAMIKNSE